MQIMTSRGVLELSQELFWDVDKNRVPDIVQDNPHWVLPRVLEYGDLIEINDIINFYGLEQSKVVLIEQRNELKPMAKSMAHVFLNLELRSYHT